MIKTIFCTSSTGVEGKNYEHIMRVIFLSRFTRLTLLISSRADFNRYLSPGTQIIQAPFGGKFGLILYTIFWMLKNKKKIESNILFTEPSSIGIIGVVAKILTKVTWIVDVWDIPIRYTGENKIIQLRIKLTKHLMRWAYRQANLFIVGIRPDLEFQYYQIPDDKLLLWQTTIWIPAKKNGDVRKTPDGQFNILCMRSMHDPACGLDVLLKAFLKVKNHIPEAKLGIIGKIHPDAEEKIKGLKDVAGVTYYGFIEHEKVLQLIQKSQLTVIPWHDDIDLAQPYPTKVMEYMTEGRVVLAARLAGIADMIKDGEDGILFQPGDADELAEKIIKLYQDQYLRDRLAANARRYHVRFDTIRKHEEIFRYLKKLTRDPADYDLTADQEFIKKYTT